MRHFNRAEYRACVDPLEKLYFGRGRGDFYRGLIKWVVALLQLRLGMIRSPRTLLASSRELLAPYAPVYRGLHVEAVIRHATGILARLPEGAVKLPPEEVAALNLPPLRLSLRRLRPTGRIEPRRHGGHGAGAKGTG